MIRALVLSLAQLGDRRIVAVLAKSLGLTLVLCLIPGVAIGVALPMLIGDLLGGWSAAAAGLAGFTVTILSLWLLFRAVAVAVIGVFGDEVVAAVEARHYPGAVARDVPLSASLAMGARSGLRVIAINLLLLPVYLVLLATGIGTPLAFLAVNGWLLGRDLGDMVAVRHCSRAEMRGWRRATQGRRFLLGVGVSALFLVPFANLLAPVLGAAMATHLFHEGRP